MKDQQAPSDERSLLVRQAGDSWLRILATHRQDSRAACSEELQRLESLAALINDPSLDRAVEQAHYIAAHGISGINVMGTMGSGKSAISSALAQSLAGWRLVDADHFHSPSNIEKMKRGEPLSDQDRLGFLLSMAHFFRTNHAVVSSCSALTDAYRAILHGRTLIVPDETRWIFEDYNPGLVTVCVVKPFEVALEQLDHAATTPDATRILDGQAHFIRVTKETPTLLKQQYAIFEMPKPWQAIVVETERYRLTNDPRALPPLYDTRVMVNEVRTALGLLTPETILPRSLALSRER